MMPTSEKTKIHIQKAPHPTPSPHKRTKKNKKEKVLDRDIGGENIRVKVVLHETIHELHKKVLAQCFLKLISKSHIVKWPFLQQVLHMKGFDHKWYDWIK
jgi:ssRNA-specific RNase YbeY (16S rRNA maturation enzyme)